MGWETARYLSLFVAEAAEHLDGLGKEVVRLEHGPTVELVDSMFRHAHSVKGMASSMGFDAAASLAHRLEDLFDTLRADLTRFDKSLGDLVLQAVDALSAQVQAASANQPPPDASALAAQLTLVTARLAPTAAASSTAPPPSSVEGAGSAPAPAPDVAQSPRYRLCLRVSPATSQPGVRGFLAYKRLSTLGNVFDLKPPLEDVKAGRAPQGRISLELETEESEESLKKILTTIADVELESLTVAAASAQAKPPPEPEARLVGQEPARTVRVKAELMDTFLDATGELLLATARVRETAKSMPEAARLPLDEAVDRVHGLVRDLHIKVMQARMTPIALITDRLPRAARDIARRRGRDLELAITGADIELDRAVVDELADPLLHLLRNAIDHGVEPPEERRMRGKDPRGRVTVNVKRVRDQVVLEVEDDGRGMDAERLKAAALERGLITQDQARTLSVRDALLLCCLPGVSTASDVTDISGRGVGMDAVKRVVESVGGSVDIDSRRGRGTRIRLSLPLTVSMVNLLLVGVGDDVFGLPITKVSGVVESPRAELSHSGNAPVLHFGAEVVPVHELATLLEVPGGSGGPMTPFVVVDGDDGRLALAVDRLLGQEEVVLKSLARPLDLVPGLAGVTILGNGRPVFILDVARLF